MAIPVKDTPLLQAGQFKVVEVKDFNFFDLTGERAKSKGSSNKSYHIEIQLANDTSGKAQIFTMWGATGSNLKEDWRHFNSEFECRKEFNRIIKSKIKKGYVEIEVAQRVIGSEDAKKIVKPVVFNNVDQTAVPFQSKLDINVQKLVKRLFGATQSFVATTLKCPLGQLTNNQIDEGRKLLDQAKVVVVNANGKLSKSNIKELTDYTNMFFSKIPHNLGYGSRGKMEELLLDDLKKIAQKEDDLDVLLDAKSAGIVFEKDSQIDDQYNSLKTDIDHIDQKDPLFSFINRLVLETRANNHHHLGKIQISNVWKYNRHSEKDQFVKIVDEIARLCGKQNVPPQLNSFIKKRTDIPSGFEEVYEKANVIPLFHGTKSNNLLGITQRGLLIRPSTAILTGAMYGNSLYFSSQSSKSINYTSVSNSYWARGNDEYGYLFLVDAALGNQKIASYSSNYTKQNIKPYHSVWAKGGCSGVLNDEFMLYDINQHYIRYIIEFKCL